MRSITCFTLGAGLLLAGACKSLDVPDLNFPSAAQLGPGASPSAVATAVQGLVALTRTTALAGTLGAYGREGMNLDPSNPQGAFNTYQNLDQDAWNGTWLSSYRTMAQANLVLSVLDGVEGISAAGKDGIRGFAKTFKAIALYHVIIALDVAGAATDAPADPTGALPPIATKAQVYAQMRTLLDEAKAHLQAAGTAPFAFTLPSGFAGFNTPATFLKFNRAFRARLSIFMGDFAGALTDLSESFLDTAQPLTLGVYFNYSTNSGDATNNLYDPATLQRFAHPSIWPGAQNKLDGTKDNRLLAKVAPTPEINRSGFTVREKMTVYNSPDARVTIIRNEELILLRAEAHMGLADRPAALADINFIRQTSGGLPAIGDPGDPGLLNELIYNRLYSLFWEQGVRWIDARRFGRLAQLPHDRPGDVVFPNTSIPRFECTQRSPQPAGCTVPAGV